MQKCFTWWIQKFFYSFFPSSSFFDFIGVTDPLNEIGVSEQIVRSSFEFATLSSKSMQEAITLAHDLEPFILHSITSNQQRVTTRSLKPNFSLACQNSEHDQRTRALSNYEKIEQRDNCVEFARELSFYFQFNSRSTLYIADNAGRVMSVAQCCCAYIRPEVN